MSNKTDFAYGWGINKPDLERISTKNMATFIRKHIELSDKDAKLSDETLVEAYKDCEDTNSGIKSLYSTISNVIFDETNICFECQSSECDTGVMLCYTAPWFYTSTEKDLTEERLWEILQPYLDELGIGDATLGDVEVEFYG